MKFPVSCPEGVGLLQWHLYTCAMPLNSNAYQDWDARTPLLHAILGGHEQTTMTFLDTAQLAGCERELANTCESETDGAKGSGLAPLHAACDQGMHSAVKALCAVGADIEKKDAAGATPLLHACKKVRTALLQKSISCKVKKGQEPQP